MTTGYGLVSLDDRLKMVRRLIVVLRAVHLLQVRPSTLTFGLDLGDLTRRPWLIIFLAISIVLAFAGLFLAFSAFCSARWRAFLIQGALAVACIWAAAYVFVQVYARGERQAEVEGIARSLFLDKLKRAPVKLQLEESGPRGFWGFLDGHWKFTGTAWLDEADVWDVTVTWGTRAWECQAEQRR